MKIVIKDLLCVQEHCLSTVAIVSRFVPSDATSVVVPPVYSGCSRLACVPLQCTRVRVRVVLIQRCTPLYEDHLCIGATVG